MEVLLTFEHSPSTQHLSVHKKISSGNFNVYHAKFANSDVECALKVFPKSSTAQKIYQHEKQIISKLKHENIITYVPIQSHNLDCNLLLTEYASYGDFLELVLKNIFRSEKLIRTYFSQLIDALSYMHRRGYAHLDVKLENLLLHKSFQLKLADFNQTEATRTKDIAYGGTRNYRAPEVIARSCKDPVAVDIYAAGIVLFVLQTGEFPFLEEGAEISLKSEDYYLFYSENEKFWQKKAKGKPVEKCFSPEFMELINGMLAKDPAQRFTINQIKQSAWYNQEVFDNKKLNAEMQRVFERTFINYGRTKSL